MGYCVWTLAKRITQERKKGYEQAKSLFTRLVKDLEELLEKERKEREKLEEERARTSERIRDIVGRDGGGEGGVKG